MFRRERIYPFRPVTFSWGARWMKMVKKEPVTIQRNTDVYPPFGTDESVPYEHAGKHPIQHLANFQFDNKLSETDKHKI